MKSFAPCLAVILTGLALMVGAAVAMATDPGARGGQAIAAPRTTNTPTPPHSRQSRGIIPGGITGLATFSPPPRGGQAR